MRNYRKPFLALVALAVLIGTFAYTPHAAAQEISGSLVGGVTDPGGAAIAGTTVKLTNLGTGEIRTDATDGQGNYQFLSLPVGEYKVESRRPGLQTLIRAAPSMSLWTRWPASTSPWKSENKAEASSSTRPAHHAD